MRKLSNSSNGMIKRMRPQDVEGIDTLGLVMAVAHSQNWIAQRVYNLQGENLPFSALPNLSGPLLLRDDGPHLTGRDGTS